MSKRSGRNGVEEYGRTLEPVAKFREAYTRFRESRLYVQVVLSLGLTAISGLLMSLPDGWLDRPRRIVNWIVAEDYDFVGQARRADAWAKSRGGWGPAVVEVWNTGKDYVDQWAEPITSRTMSGTLSSAAPVLPVNGALLRGFGWLPPSAGDGFHEGLDILAPPGTAVVAVSDGTVIRVGKDDTLGSVVEVDHGTITALYGQVTDIQVNVGETVRQGQALAVVAPSTGAEQLLEPHLHFEVRVPSTGVQVDPAIYLGLGGKQL